MDIVAKTIHEKTLDMSNLNISSHALTQYNLKCFPLLSLIEVVEKMRLNLKGVKRVEVNKEKRKHHINTEYYIDNDDIIYVISDNTVVTTYPNQRIFKAKSLFSNKKTGMKWT